ncbi:MAG: CT583 family protein [Chlamydiae bacterium]|nr:CT583 family protein [Chlamydiota bacterium]
MSQIKNILDLRMKGKEQPKMAAMAERSMNGQSTNFSGVFTVSEITPLETDELRKILEKFTQDGGGITQDLFTLKILTSEIRAISNQSSLLHGERIKRAQDILKRYKEGAFSAWLQKAYGNRQTPYNFLQYFEFHSILSKEQRSLLEDLPRQAIYSLASRKIPLEDKLHLISHVKGQTKKQILTEMRMRFPLSEKDRRKSIASNQAEKLLKEAFSILNTHTISLEDSRPLKKITRQILKKLKGD